MTRRKSTKKSDDRLGPHEGHGVVTIDGVRHRKCRFCGVLFAPDDREGLRLHVERVHVRSRRRAPARSGLGLVQTHLPQAEAPTSGGGLTRRLEDGSVACATCGATFGPDEDRALKFHLATHAGAKRKPKAPKKKPTKTKAAAKKAG